MTNIKIPIIKNPTVEYIESSAIKLLLKINQPFWILIEGHDQYRCRIVTTLLHGNESSGIIALHKLLLEQKKPVVNMYFLIGAVQSATQRPYFTNRYLLNGQDLNRCFKSNGIGYGRSIAKNILEFITLLKPEAVLDLHNTTSPGESFAITVKDTYRHRRLARFFTNKIVINHFSLGAIMEHNNCDLPIVTIECGGANDPQAIKTAYFGLEEYCTCEDLWQDANSINDKDLIVYDKPLRLEYIKDGCISFGAKENSGADITILNTFSNDNFKNLKKGQLFAYTRSRDINIFKAFIDNPSNNLVGEYFSNDNGQVIVKKDITVFMLTTNPEISKNDCICYFV